MNDSYKEWIYEKAKEMRDNPTKSERDFLDYVNSKYNSRPCCQYPVLVGDKYYILDFFFRNSNIAVEIDGSVHNKRLDEDKIRDKQLLEEKGIYTIRLYNKDCNVDNLNERLDDKFNYARKVLKKYGYNLPKPSRRKTKKKTKKSEMDKEIGKIMNWVRKNTATKEKDVRQFAINIYKSKKNHAIT